jgi:hypothetical protein
MPLDECFSPQAKAAVADVATRATEASAPNTCFIMKVNLLCLAIPPPTQGR